MEFRRWTPLTFLFPRRFIEAGQFWDDFDLRDWAAGTYEWTQDPWNGLVDFAKRPRETITDDRRDCEDFALVAASWAVANDRPDVGLGFCWESNRPWPTHVITYDTDYVYSSGNIIEGDVDEWIADSKYAFALKRRVK